MVQSRSSPGLTLELTQMKLIVYQSYFKNVKEYKLRRLVEKKSLDWPKQVSETATYVLGLANSR